LSASPDQSPFFLVGAIKSGTTVLRLILGHHPHICHCDEWDFRFLLHDYGVDPKLDAVGLARDVVKQRYVTDGKPIVGGNVHHGFARLPEVWPQARFIYLRRDPRDVARCCAQMGIGGSAWGATHVWTDAELQWAKITQQVPESRRMEVRIEDVIENTNQALSDICRFLGTQFDPAMLEIERDTDYTRPQKHVSYPWRMSAARSEIQQIESRIGKAAIEAAGYRHSGLPEIAPGELERLWLRLESLYGRVLRVRPLRRAGRNSPWHDAGARPRDPAPVRYDAWPRR
jgi:hypothetical protein